MTFVDTAAWYALCIPTDTNHAAAVGRMAARRGPLMTTDYVIDETLTLMRSRGQRDVAIDFGVDVFAGRLGTVYYLNRADIAAAWDMFQRFRDKEWSFTDCTSKVVMEALGVGQAFSVGHHFRQFGTVTVLP